MKSNEDPNQLKQQLKEAQVQLEQLKLKNVALETMISIAEKQFEIEIRKKSGRKTAQELNTKYPLTSMRNLCGQFGKTRQAYYQQRSQQEKNALQADLVVQQVIRVRAPLPGVGTGKLQHLL